MNKHTMFLLLAFIPLGAFTPVSAFTLTGASLPVQNKYTLAKEYSVTIHGTSNLRDWQDSVEIVTGDMIAGLEEDGSIDLDEIRIVMQVRSIKSDMGKVMDNKTYAALKADANPEITFILNIPVKLIQAKTGEKALAVHGYLRLAGISRPVVMQVNAFSIGKEKMKFEGSQKINMADYGVKPPTALFGAIKARPEITILFKTSFKIKKNA